MYHWNDYACFDLHPVSSHQLLKLNTQLAVLHFSCRLQQRYLLNELLIALGNLLERLLLQVLLHFLLLLFLLLLFLSRLLAQSEHPLEAAEVPTRLLSLILLDFGGDLTLLELLELFVLEALSGNSAHDDELLVGEGLLELVPKLEFECLGFLGLFLCQACFESKIERSVVRLLLWGHLILVELGNHSGLKFSIVSDVL
jgi:hypothetical protein